MNLIQKNFTTSAKLVAIATLIVTCFFIDISHVKAQCNGVPNVPQTAGSLLAGPFLKNGGRTAVIGFHQGCLWVVFESAMSNPGSDNVSQICDISNPREPKCQASGVPRDSVYNFHGFMEEGQFINFHPNQWWTVSNGKASNAVRPVPEYNNKSWDAWGWGRGLLFQPWAIRSYWNEYSASSSPTDFYLGNTRLANWSPRVKGHAFLVGNILYFIADRNGGGVDAYDMTPSLNSPGTAPRLIGTLSDRSIGGYDPGLWGSGNKLKTVIPNGPFGRRVQIVDLSDPQNMKVELNVQLEKHPGGNFNHDPNPNYVQFQDNFAFTDQLKIDMRTNQISVIINPAPARINITQFSLPVGNLLISGGIQWGHEHGFADNVAVSRQGVGIWASQSAPDTNKPEVGYHIPRNGQTNYPVSAPITALIHETLRSETIVMGQTVLLRPISEQGFGASVPARANFSYNDHVTITPSTRLQSNTSYEVTFVADGIKDAVGNGIKEYSFRFSTGTSVFQGSTSSTPTPTSVIPTSTPRPVTPVATASPTVFATSRPTVVPTSTQAIATPTVAVGVTRTPSSGEGSSLTDVKTVLTKTKDAIAQLETPSSEQIATLLNKAKSDLSILEITDSKSRRKVTRIVKRLERLINSASTSSNIERYKRSVDRKIASLVKRL
jgi:hypothetical protein